MAHKTETKRPTFIVKGKTFLAKPNMDEFLKEAGLPASTRARIRNRLTAIGIELTDQLFDKTLKDLEGIDQISGTMGRRIYEHALRVKRKGEMVVDFTGLKDIQKNYNFLSTGSSSLDEMMRYTSRQSGWRSSTVVELYGKPGTGKTQFCLTAAVMCLRSVEKGGWGKGIAYIDTEGSFDAARFENLCDYWGVDKEILNDKFIHGTADSFDELDRVIEGVASRTEDSDLGMIIIDNLISPLNSQYPTDSHHLNNYYNKMAHLKRTMDRIRNLVNRKNLICIYTNHVEKAFSNYGDPNEPQGGLLLGYSSDIRIRLRAAMSKNYSTIKISRKEHLTDYGIKLGRANIVDCGFLAEKEGLFLIGAFGVGDPVKYDELLDHSGYALMYGFLGIDSEGEKIEMSG